MKRGEVWWASLHSPIGRRPVLVVQSNAFNDSRIRSVVVALITSNLVWEGGPGNVRLAQGEGGVPKVSVVNVSQLHTIERANLVERLGILTASLQERVDAGLRLSLQLPGGAAPGAMEAAAEYVVQRARLRDLLKKGGSSRPGPTADSAYFEGLRRRIRKKRA